jgi:hypothetical protein
MHPLWLISVVALTQAQEETLTASPPDDFLERAEVRAFATQTANREEYQRLGDGLVVALDSEPSRPHVFVVLDGRGRVDTAATAQLQACARPPEWKHSGSAPMLLRLAGGRGIVAAQSGCLVAPDRTVLPVESVWGGSWRDLAASQPATFDPELRGAIAKFRRTAAYRENVRGQQPQLTAVPLQQSPFDLVLVTLTQVDPIDASQRRQKVFVVERKSGKARPAETASLDTSLRDELVATCGGGTFSMTAIEAGVTFAVDVGGRWEGDGAQCEMFVKWDPAAKEMVMTRGDLQSLAEARRREKLHDEDEAARRLWRRGKRAEAIAKWEALGPAAIDDAEDAEVCRALAEAYVGIGDEVKARRQLLACIVLVTNRSEAELLFADFLREHLERTSAIAHYELALVSPIAEGDRARAAEAITALELELAADALAGHKLAAARLHYRRVLAGPLTDAQAREARAGIDAVDGNTAPGARAAGTVGTKYYWPEHPEVGP